jgi:DNA-binding response OmpR family regulator
MDKPKPVKRRIALIEDDKDLNNLLKFSFESSGDYSVKSFFQGSAQDERELRDFEPELVLLDVMLPQNSGFEILKNLRCDSKYEQIPVILLTAKSEEEDKIEGFEHGADDYITKPFSPRELILRVSALLRRIARNSEFGSNLSSPPALSQPTALYLNSENKLEQFCETEHF